MYIYQTFFQLFLHFFCFLQLIITAMWIVVFSVIVFLFLYQNEADHNHTRIKSTFFFPLQRPLWALCLCWISYACLSGNGGFINIFLSLPSFQVMGKVTYSTYLVHFLILTLDLASARDSPYFSDYNGVRALIKNITLLVTYFDCICFRFELSQLIFSSVTHSVLRGHQPLNRQF